MCWRNLCPLNVSGSTLPSVTTNPRSPDVVKAVWTWMNHKETKFIKTKSPFLGRLKGILHLWRLHVLEILPQRESEYLHFQPKKGLFIWSTGINTLSQLIFLLVSGDSWSGYWAEEITSTWLPSSFPEDFVSLVPPQAMWLLHKLHERFLTGWNWWKSA